MNSSEVILDGFGRIRGVVRAGVEGLSAEALGFRPYPRGNSIAWLVWHLTRVQDDHVADAAGREQVWTSGGWAERFGLPFAEAATGYGHSSDEVGAVTVESADLLIDYHEAVYAATVDYVGSLADADLDVVIDESWDPPVTLGVRLVSVIADDLQHAGQAAYVRGIWNAQAG